MTRYTNNYTLIIEGDVIEGGHLTDTGYLPLMQEIGYGRAGGQREWYLCRDSDMAEHAVSCYWEDMARHDTEEFVAIFGTERIVEWWLRGQSFEDTISEIDATEVFATCDGNEYSVDDIGLYIDRHYPQVEYYEALWDEVGRVWTDQEQDDPDLEEIRLLLIGWQNLCDELSFEPEIAYRAN